MTLWKIQPPHHKNVRINPYEKNVYSLGPMSNVCWSNAKPGSPNTNTLWFRFYLSFSLFTNAFPLWHAAKLCSVLLTLKRISLLHFVITPDQGCLDFFFFFFTVSATRDATFERNFLTSKNVIKTEYFFNVVLNTTRFGNVQCACRFIPQLKVMIPEQALTLMSLVIDLE